jgi:HEPN domain-containing protein
VDVQKQIDYWRTGSEEDIGAAEVLFEKERYRHALFFAHLSLEKAIKAHVCKQTCEMPPKIHNLTRLAERAKLTLDASQREFLLAFDEYQLEGRYPDMVSAPLGKQEAREQVAKAKEMGRWLISLL